MTDFELYKNMGENLPAMNTTIVHYRLATENPYLEAFLVLLLIASFGWAIYVIYLLVKKYGKNSKRTK